MQSYEFRLCNPVSVPPHNMRIRYCLQHADCSASRSIEYAQHLNCPYGLNFKATRLAPSSVIESGSHYNYRTGFTTRPSGRISPEIPSDGFYITAAERALSYNLWTFPNTHRSEKFHITS